MTDSTRSESRSDGAPERIYLQHDPEETGEPFNEAREVTWCKDKINSTDIEYVRADAVSELGTVSTYDVLVDARDCIENLTALVEKPAPTYVEPCLQRIEVAMETLGEKSLLPSSGERSEGSQ